MKKQRFYSVTIFKPGDHKASFDPSGYLKELIEKPKSGFAFIDGPDKGTSVWSSSSWSEASYSEIFLRDLRLVLWIFARACQKVIRNSCRSIAFSRLGRWIE